MKTPTLLSVLLLPAALTACDGAPDEAEIDSAATVTEEDIAAASETPVGRSVEERGNAPLEEDEAPVSVEQAAGMSPAPAAEGANDPPTPAPAVAENPEAGLIIGDGQLQAIIKATGSTRTFPFGAPREQVMTMLDAVRGTPSRAPSLSKCAGGPVTAARWPDGLTVFFRGGELAGWKVAGGSELTTMTGLGIGTTLADFQRDFAADPQETPAGWEARTGNLTARFSGGTPDAVVQSLSSGAVCEDR
ncbi:hypothetical protein [Pacificimonas flava]|uniref:Secreted protein n=1 Tax=Pacificimonas flava TaxID=1234595 RepID=M2TJX2_9SPHN|nr:hypothetical protein [Pacificimonas flava]EMD81961.1 hypothetical protein C725_2617 [Pacificimonas flava]MBB5280475.1 hypothetical protein [Pacificimonas flava]